MAIDDVDWTTTPQVGTFFLKFPKDTTGARVQGVSLHTVTGGDGAHTFTPVAAGPNGGLLVDATIVADSVNNILHDAVDAGGPNKIGHRAVTSVSAQALVSANDRTDAFAGVDGVPIVRQHSNLEDNLTGTVTNTDGASTALIAAQASGIKTYLCTLDLFNSSGAAVVVDLKDGSTIKKTYLVPAGGGFLKTFTPPLAGTAATAWNIDAQAPTTTLYANAEGFKSKI